METFRMGNVEKQEGSECSSGCESGWTMYLDQSDEKPGSVMHQKKCAFEDEEEDLSMVSDASSGPPHYHDDDLFCYCNHHGENNGCFCSASSPSSAALVKKGGKRRRIGVEMKQQKQLEKSCGLLDDTASSPFLDFPKKNTNMATAKNPSVDDVLEISYGFSATHFKAKSALHKQLSYLNPTSDKPNCREGGGKNKIW